MKTKRRILSVILCLALVVLLSLTMGEDGKADYPPGNWNCAQVKSREAGVLFYRAVSKLYLSLMHLEQNKPNIANDIVYGVEIDFCKIAQLYQDIEAIVPNRNIPFKKMEEALKPAKQNFNQYNVVFPDNWKALAQINKAEVEKFKEFLKEIKYSSDPRQNRKVIKLMNDAIFRIMSLGLSISEIASKCS